MLSRSSCTWRTCEQQKASPPSGSSMMLLIPFSNRYASPQAWVIHRLVHMPCCMACNTSHSFYCAVHLLECTLGHCQHGMCAFSLILAVASYLWPDLWMGRVCMLCERHLPLHWPCMSAKLCCENGCRLRGECTPYSQPARHQLASANVSRARLPMVHLQVGWLLLSMLECQALPECHLML